MPTYRAPLREFRFVLDEFLRIGERIELPGYAELGDGTLPALLEGSARVCEGVAQPLNARGDAEGCTLEGDAVRTPAGFPDAYRRFAEGGWIGLALDPAYGGKGLPAVAAEACYEMLSSANMAFSGYVELSEAVFRSIHAHGTKSQKARFLPKLAAGEWTGAMHLTEPQAGSDLRLVRTRAEPAPGGGWRLHGAKCFITNAEHDLAGNIVHLVLARVPGDPPGSGGLSLFVAPKFLVGADGRTGARNAVRVVSLEHKMGLRAAPTGIVHYEGAEAELVGERGQGLRAMFTMVNDARLGVALQGLSQAEVARQNAAHYARERRQGRPPGAAGSGAPQAAGSGAPQAARGDDPAPIAAHPDVRRMLLTMRAFTESARGLALWVALQIDVAARHPDPAARTRAEDLLALLTPVLKSHLTDGGSECAQLALQCFGGYGYVRDTGVEQFARDVRITQIYEGTNGIQALDLVRRKLAQTGGGAAFLGIARETLRAARDDAVTAPLAALLAPALDDLAAATGWMQARAGSDPLDAAAGATDYQRLFGLVALGWIWLEYARIAARTLAAGTPEPRYYTAKLVLARFYLARLPAEAAMLRARAALGAGDLMALAEEDL